MKNWDDVIVHSQKGVENNIYVLNDNVTYKKKTEQLHLGRSKKRSQYTVGERYPGVYFTQREAECLYYLGRGLTIVSTAKMLELSPRTVEFYVKNMKVKVKLKTKSQLIEMAHDVGLMPRLGDALLKNNEADL
jgi:DNA-binding CsgD family transcriptional regulator